MNNILNTILYFTINAIAVSAFAPIFILYLKNMKLGQVVREEGVQSHLSKMGTPTMGGVIFISVWILSIYIIGKYTTINNYMDVFFILSSTVFFGSIGFADDFMKITINNTNGLNGKKKIIGILAYSMILYYIFPNYIKITIPFLNGYMPTGIFLFLIYFVIATATTNAVNLTDGLDGLSASVTMIITLFFTALAFHRGLYNLSYINAAFSGALLGYIFYNWYPAKVMMGDTGSFAMGGFVLANIFILDIVWWLLLFGFVYVFETFSVIIQVFYYKMTKKRIFKMAPFHHHLELSGYSEQQIVIMMSITTILLTILTWFFVS